MMTRCLGIWAVVCFPLSLWAQGDKDLRIKADGLFAQGSYAEAAPLYSQLVSLNPGDIELNYRYGACSLYSGGDKEKAIGFLTFATKSASPPALAWYFLGRADHLTYHFKEALAAYEHYRGTADKKTIAEHPVDALEQQCRNGQNLLSNLKEIDVHNKVEVDGAEFFRFYDLGDIGGKIVVTPDELKTSLDKKSKDRSLVYLPGKGGPIYFSSLGKDGRTGRDIYRTELMPTGEFATPVKVAGYINTDQDEDFACMSADGRTLYFCSKGHNSMGGYDVFKSLYDAGNDVFGAPENMDFAVNTPDDDVLYLVDAEGKEACFASGRDSKQGMLHVYRVSTAQVPVNITVLKGTFASQFDAQDRKAHIVVEDAVSREQVADVRTDINGGYVLALPRSGKYKFMVEAGPSARTHVGMVEIPRNSEAKAYRQEMTLIDQGGEKLMIKNYFDEPLQDDLIDLALAEITRRAHLDPTANRPAVEQPPVEQTPADVITQAGFAGDVTKESAQKMAQDDAAQLEAVAKDYEEQAAAAYGLAENNVQQADDAIAEAKRLVSQAQALADEAAKNQLMTQAARARQRSREADMRARSAYRTGQDLDAERLATQQKAVTARKVSGDLTSALSTNNDAAALTALQQLKKRMDEKNGPEGTVDVAERMRRNATSAQKEAATALQQADAQRAEETELKDRIARLEREQSVAGGKKKEDLGKQIAELRTQQAFLQQEVAAAFVKAKRAQQDAAVSTGQAGLAKHLAGSAERKAAPRSSTAVAELGQRVNGTEARISGVAVDERYMDAIAAEAEASEQKAFDWQSNGAQNDATASVPTTTTARDTTGQAARLASNTVTLANGQANDPALLKGGEAHPLGNTADTADNATAANNGQAAGKDGASTASDTNAASATPSTNAQQDAHADNSTAARNTTSGNTDAGTAPGNDGAIASRIADGTTNARPVAPGDRGNDLASVRGVGAPLEPASGNDQATPVQSGSNTGVKEATAETPTAEEQAFVLANELAELHQLRAAEKDKVQQDSLDARIARTRQRMRETQQRPADASTAQATNDRAGDTGSTADNGTTNEVDTASTEVPEASALDSDMAHGPPMTFDTTLTEAQLVDRLFASYTQDKSRIEAGEGDIRERAQELHGLELMLVDSIDAESARQANGLEQASDKAVVLARMDKLRKVKEVHVQRAAQVLADAEQQYAALESRRLEDAALAAANAGGNQPPVTGGEEAGGPPTPHNDSYVTIARSSEHVYESLMDHRSKKVAEAVSNKDRDIQQMSDLEERIDSMETLLEETPRGKKWDKLRAETDRSIDDHLILRTELGQRLAYIMREEYDAAKDSSADLRSAVTKKGLAPGEPLMQMAQRMEDDAKTAMDVAGARRKEADRSENIVLRDSLYRQAYGLELQALRDMDRALTVRSHMLSDGFKAGSAPSYAEIERSMFGSPSDLAWSKTAGGDVAGTSAADTTTLASAQGVKPVQADAQQRPDYKTYLGPDGRPIPQQTSATDSSSLQLPAQQQAEQARSLEQRSVVAADRANAAQDSAATAARRDREDIEREAAHLRHVSDSLHTAAVAGQRDAQALEAKQHDDADKAAFAERLRKYYYLSNEEQAAVMGGEDESRYFNITAKAMDQHAQAGEARNQAGDSRKLATALDQQATALRTDSSQADQVRKLDERSVQLRSRADSLAQHADLLDRAANVNGSQAALVLQALPPERSSAIMALEQRARRIETPMAQAQPVTAPANVAPADAAPASASAQPATTRTVSTASTSGAEGSRPATAARPTETMPNTARPAATNNALPASSGTSTNAVPATAAVPGALPGTLPALTGDVFSMDNGTTRQGAIPIDAPMPAGVVFKVQVGAFKHAVSEQAFNDMTPVTGETVGNGLTRYTAGMFTNASSAVKASEQVRARGYRDAFVVAYQDGKRISVSQAIALTSPALAQAPAAPAHSPIVVQPASQLPTINSAGTEDAAVLNNYAASAQEVLAAFKPSAEATAYYNDPSAAPANQVEAIRGLFFTVQVGVYSKPTALDKLFNITPLNSERTENNKIRYTTGVFLDLESARVRKDGTVTLGVKDAFITAYLNGKRIPMRDARALLAKFGNSILADPSTLKR